jgi:hypothetical protein
MGEVRFTSSSVVQELAVAAMQVSQAALASSELA